MTRVSVRTRLVALLLVLVGVGLGGQGTAFLLTARDIAVLQDKAAALLIVQHESHQLESAIHEQQDAVAGYLITGNATLLETDRRAQIAEAEAAGQTQAQAGEYPEVQSNVTAIREAMSAWRLQYAEPAIAYVRAGLPLSEFAPDLQRTELVIDAKIDAALDHYTVDLTALQQLTNDALNTTRSEVTLVFGLEIVVVTLGVLVAIALVTHWVVRPVDSLLRTAKLVRAGEEVPFAVRSSDEIGRLGGELEQMRSTLASQTNEAGVVNRFTELTSFVESDGDVARATLDALSDLVAPDDGTIHISNRSRDRALPEGSIGAVHTSVIQLGQLGQCPGVKRSSLYHTPDLGATLAVRCPLYPASSGTLVCIPLVALGDVIGAVHLHWADVDAIPLEVRAAVSRITDHASLAIANRRLVLALQGQASTDGRTGLPNSRAFDEALEQALSSRSAHDPMAVLMLDVDHFKQFNDRNGHPAGDQALRTFAGVLTSSIREGDLAARYGGEEFSLFLPGATARDAAMVAERIRSRTEAAVIELSPGHRDQITVSIGIAVWPDDSSSRVGLLEAADAALYRAKRGGRNRWAIAGEVLSPREGELASTEAEIAALVAAASGILEGEPDVEADAGPSGSLIDVAASEPPEPLHLARAG